MAFSLQRRARPDIEVRIGDEMWGLSMEDDLVKGHWLREGEWMVIRYWPPELIAAAAEWISIKPSPLLGKWFDPGHRDLLVQLSKLPPVDMAASPK